MRKKISMIVFCIMLAMQIYVSLNNHKQTLDIIIPEQIFASILTGLSLFWFIKEIIKERKITNEDTYKKYNYENSYSKKSLMSIAELNFFYKLQNILSDKDNLLIQGQIPLSSVVNKENYSRYANELYKTIDFGIFDENMNVIVLIELNDSTHFREDRIERDEKVKYILDSAEIPLLTFWLNQNDDSANIERELNNYI